MNRGRPPKAKPKFDKAWISRKEAIAMLGCGKIKYYELVKYKQINAISFTNQVFVERASVEQFVATHNKYNMKRKEYFSKEESDG